MTMRLNDLKPHPNSRKVRLRVGRGPPAGPGKTCGRGVKGQRARKGGYHKVGFEGGQMPIQRRLPKVGFRSKMAPLVAEVRLNELARVEGGVIDLASLKRANLVPAQAERARSRRASPRAAGSRRRPDPARPDGEDNVARTPGSNPITAFGEATRFTELR